MKEKIRPSLDGVHIDVLYIMADDATNRAVAGELSLVEYTVQIGPLNTEIFRHLHDVHQDLLKRVAELESIPRREPWELDKQDMEFLISDYQQFLTLKELDKEFDDWVYEQIKASEQASIIKADEPLESSGAGGDSE